MANSLQLSCAQLSELFLMGKIFNDNIKFKRWIRIENETNKQKPKPKTAIRYGVKIAVIPYLELQIM